MTPQHVISQLLESDEKNSPNVTLLKKLMLTTSRGRLRINGQPPDNKVSLANYLFDDERILFDFTRLNEEKKALFQKWLLEPHKNEKQRNTLTSFAVDEHRGFTAEVILSWWQVIKGWFQGRKSDYWVIDSLNINLNYQLNGIEMFHGKDGLLVGFDQFLVPPSGAKYRYPKDEQSGTLANAKRLTLTDKLVDMLVKEMPIEGHNQVNIDFGAIVKKPHPQAVDVIDEVARHKEMESYRKTYDFFQYKPWYSRLWAWITSLFGRLQEEPPKENSIEQCGLIALNENPLEMPFEQIEELLDNKDSLILFNEELFYANTITHKIHKIKIDESNYKEFTQLENKFTSSYSSVEPEDLHSAVKLIKLATVELVPATDNIGIWQRVFTKEIIVTEKKPDIEEIVFCGGGAKIFAHVGVWQALNHAKVHPKKFSGSSAGAIMALLCYLGYSADEINEFFKKFKKEHLIHFDIDSTGFSDAHSMKTALDFIITHKVKQIVTKYGIPYPEGKITFEVLNGLKEQFPDCGLGDELFVTSTRKKARKTRYYSHTHSPKTEVSEAVKVSASMPVLYRPTFIDGEEHNDGGILNNFPTEVFKDDQTTLLESADGNSLKVLAVQFDNGTERDTIDKIRNPVYREGFFQNLVYKVITGVDDPASAWEQDRRKLRKLALQSVTIDVGDITAASFSIDDSGRIKMIESGYNATKEYLSSRYGSCDPDAIGHNKELMYTSFTSLGDLLAYCCYRNDKDWFEKVHNIIVESDLPNKHALMKQSMSLRELYFKQTAQPVEEAAPVVLSDNEEEEQAGSTNTFFGNPIIQEQNPATAQFNADLFLTLYPIFLELSPALLKHGPDLKWYEKGRHKVGLYTPFNFLNEFSKFQGHTHIVLYLFIQLAKALKNDLNYQSLDNLQKIGAYLKNNKDLYKKEYYCQWDLTPRQTLRVLNALDNDDELPLLELLGNLRKRNEPMETIEKGLNHDDVSNGSNEGYWPSNSM